MVNQMRDRSDRIVYGVQTDQCYRSVRRVEGAAVETDGVQVGRVSRDGVQMRSRPTDRPRSSVQCKSYDKENELKEKLRLEQLAEHRRSSLNYSSPVHRHHHLQHHPHLQHPHHINHVAKAEEPRAAHRPPLPLPPQPMTVVPAAAAHHTDRCRHRGPAPRLIAAPAGPLPLWTAGDRQLQVAALAPESSSPPPSPTARTTPLPTSPNSRGSPPDDGRHLDNKKRPGGAGTRDVHNKLEKHRRAHLKECFEMLKKNIPNVDEKKTSNLCVLRSALRYIQTLKRKEKEFEHEMERLAREKIATQQRLDELKNELSQWMDVTDVERVLRQTVQPEEDQASTSTASEGEDMDDDDLDGETAHRVTTALPAVPQALPPEQQRKTPSLTPAPPPSASATVATHPLQHISIQHKAMVPQTLALPKPLAATVSGVPSATAIQALIPTQTQMVTAPQPCLQPTVIAHAPASHASVIHAVNHVIQATGHKHMAHLAPSTTTTTTTGALQLAPGRHHHHHHHQQISHITVHPVAHLGPHLPTIYSQSVAVSQPTMVGHIAHTLSHAHAQLNGGMPGQPAGGIAAATTAIVSKQTAVGAQVVPHHPQLVGQTMLNPVTMVTMPSFPVRL
ncbi:hypothetical protein NHX12_007934 [Muraenolepis orangiensis]|uniref:Max-binding protein MNT n=1 Tax=Muraenolepis orangiensis TaxID=630683 RepID=A0A9Q0I7M5_9TELE|nr:hypothetical protein NHX12_007934 [Muraenolepis orangiensis]